MNGSVLVDVDARCIAKVLTEFRVIECLLAEMQVVTDGSQECLVLGACQQTIIDVLVVKLSIIDDSVAGKSICHHHLHLAWQRDRDWLVSWCQRVRVTRQQAWF